MAVKKRKKSEIKGTAPWLTTMGDMNNLLMCFFIVMMGDITEVPREEFLLTLTSFRGSLGILEGGKSISKGRLADMGNNIMSLPSTERQTQFAKMRRKAMEVLKPEIQSRYVRVSEEEKGLVISIYSDLFFAPGSATIKSEAKGVLHKVGMILREIDNFVRIEGHTDNSPVPPVSPTEGRNYETNWELSGARSINVLKYLSQEERVKSKQLSAVAFGQYRPIDDNNVPEGRAYNRRVDIVILTEKGVEESKNKDISRPLPDEEWLK